MYTDVADYIRRYEICDRVRASFVPRTEVLHPLPIMGMFYCWSVKLAGPLPKSKGGNVYVMVMIEHFSKWVEVK